MADYQKPLPLPDLDTQPYWEGTKAHELRAQKCSSCDHLRWPPQSFCPHCYSFDFKWITLSRTGTVESYVVVHQATSKAFTDDVPYTIAKILIHDSDGSVVLTSSLIDVAWDEVRVGMRVTATFDDVTTEVTLPRFRPDE